jgi:hypothetical protein
MFSNHIYDIEAMSIVYMFVGLVINIFYSETEEKGLSELKNDKI